MYNLPETPESLARILPSNVRKTGVDLIRAKTNKGYFRAIKTCAHRTEFYGRYQENTVTEYYLHMTNRDLTKISFECIPGVVIRDLKGCHLVTEVTLTPRQTGLCDLQDHPYDRRAVSEKTEARYAAA